MGASDLAGPELVEAVAAAVNAEWTEPGPGPGPEPGPEHEPAAAETVPTAAAAEVETDATKREAIKLTTDAQPVETHPIEI